MSLHYVVDGLGGAPTIVLSASLGTTLEMWEPQVEALAAHFQVVRFDRRGHGRSPVVEGTATIDDLGNDILGLLDTLSLERVSFCGISLGGLEGIWLGINAPSRIERLVLCCTAAAFLPRQNWVDRGALVRAEGTGAIADAALERWFRPLLEQTDPDVVARYRAMLVSTPAEGYAACCDALAEADLRDRLGEIEAPTLVISGADDPVSPPAASDALAASIPGAIHTVIEDAAHIANVEQPEAFTAALLDHLEAR